MDKVAKPKTCGISILHNEKKSKLLANLFSSSVKYENSIWLAVGPEGGFSKEELDILMRTNFKQVSLGLRRLRSETAAITSVGLIDQLHISTLNDIDENDCNVIAKIHLAANKIASERGISESGFRTVFNCNKDAGQAVFHIHMHLVGGRKMNWPPG